ncbi:MULTISPECIES: hypothetical protein [Thermomonosporaceae]|uniref:hypothetical protein n=1 Tax=Thermomonosporaceae TaxID=2012 RepID=UPI00255A77CB|nr:MULTISPECIES: hypothetical protein [Thermomonosporaceae]MDL4772123.1 hypothetical protein [Actinomadura xylanilytica]
MELHERSVLALDAPVPEGVVDAGVGPAAARVAELVAGGRPVLVTLVAAGPGPVEAEDPGLLATASVYAWLGVRVFRAPEPCAPAVRQALDMVASIRGERRPALARRGLA